MLVMFIQRGTLRSAQCHMALRLNLAIGVVEHGDLPYCCSLQECFSVCYLQKKVQLERRRRAASSVTLKL